MTIPDQLNSAPLYLICGGIIAVVALLCVIFMVRAYRAGKAIGMDTTKMKRVIVSSATFSVLPAVGILLGVIALSGSLGIPWPWLRLSVIGALHYETQVAQAAAEQVGMSTLSASEMTASGFSTIALLMSVCIMWGMVLSILFNRRYTRKLGSYIGSFVSSGGLFRFEGSWLPLAVVAVSALVMALFVFLGSRPKTAWVENFSVAASMLVGMAAAVVIRLL